MQKLTSEEIIRNITLLVIQVNRQCNFRCSFCCNNDGAKSASIPTEKIKELIKTFPNLNEIILTGGETLLFPEYVFEIIESIKEANQKINLQLNTTGIILNNEILERLKKSVDVIHISINTLNPLVFKKIKGVSPKFIEVLNKNIKRYVDAGFYVIIDNCVSKDNIKEVIEIYTKCEELGVKEYAVSQMILNGRASKDMLPDFQTFKKSITELIEHHKKRVKSGSNMMLQLWCLHSDKLKEHRDLLVNGKIPKATTSSCCCGSSMLYASAEGYIMPCSLGFDHNDFKDCSIHEKTIKQILDEKPIYKKINENIGLCRERGVCKLFNEKIKGTFYD